VTSSLCKIVRACLSRPTVFASIYIKRIIDCVIFNHSATVVRSMSGGHNTMDRIPSSFEWRKFKDHMVDSIVCCLETAKYI